MTMINLLPWREALREERKKIFFTALGLTAGAAILVMLLTHFVMSERLSQQKARNQILQREIATLNQRLKAIRGYQAERAKLIGRMEVIQALQFNRPQVVHLFEQIVKVLPKGVHLTKISRKGDIVILQGVAESNTYISTLMRNIEKSPWLSHARLSKIKTDDKSGKQNSEFSLQMQLREGSSLLGIL
jgi:type IV pilus assembly protein PilN